MVSLLISWPDRIKPGRRIDDFVSLMDIAPTVLEAANIERPQHMLAKSLMPLMTSESHGVVDQSRDHVIIGRERHVGEARRDRAPYPSRALRTADFLLIRNFHPDRSPMGDVYDREATPEQLLRDHYLAYPDMDASPTKTFLLRHKDSQRKFFEMAFAARPEFELYDLKQDPDQVNNVAGLPNYANTQQALTQRLMSILRETGDPRVTGGGDTFDRKPFVDPSFVPPPKKKKPLKL